MVNVIHNGEGRVTCVAHRVFQVEVINSPSCEDIVFVGQSVVESGSGGAYGLAAA